MRCPDAANSRRSTLRWLVVCALCSLASFPAYAQSTPSLLITSLNASPPTIRPGQSSTLTWTTQGAVSTFIDQGVGARSTAGSFAVSPSVSTTFTLTASSADGRSVKATVNVTVMNAPNVVVASFPPSMVAWSGASAETSYLLANVGGAATTVTLHQNGSFFTQSPASFLLPAGGNQKVTIRSSSSAKGGAYSGASTPVGGGVAPGLQVPVRLFVKVIEAIQLEPPLAVPQQNRVDVGGSTAPSGSVSFTNTGQRTLSGIATSDSAWLVPQSDVTINPGMTGSIAFSIDRSKRPAATGSASAVLSLTYATGLMTEPFVRTATVTVIDTATLGIQTTIAKPPALSGGEVALFVPGVGRSVGNGGSSISDLALVNHAVGGRSISDLRLYFTPAGSPTSQTATLPALGNSPVALADVLRNVFGSGGTVGSLQLRTSDAASISLTATAANASDGVGTPIPTFRSDRAVGAGRRIFLTGLRADAVTHTDLFIQETAGSAITVQTDFRAADGRSLGVRSDPVAAFGLAYLPDAAPNGTVSAILMMSGGNGAFLAYATPVDEQSNDTWSVVDWSRQYGYAGDDPVVIPLGGAISGAHGELFRSEIAIMNSGSDAATGTLRYVSESGATGERVVTIDALKTFILADAAAAFVGGQTIAQFVFIPARGTFAVTSRLYTAYRGKAGTFNASVPIVAASKALSVGSTRTIAPLEDASTDTIAAERPSTLRVRFGMAETSGRPVKVRVTLRYSFFGSLTVGSGSWSKEYDLTANQFLYVGSLTNEILGSGRSAVGDLRDLTADFQVVGGSGAAIFYTWSIDNGTGDSSVQVAASPHANDPTAVCAPSPRIACLLDNRLKATVRFRNAFDNGAVDTDAFVKKVTGFASAASETAFFYFNSENNIELLLKVLDQGNRDSQNRVTLAVLYGSATPLKLELTITDTRSGATRTYTSQASSMRGGTDFTAFLQSRFDWFSTWAAPAGSLDSAPGGAALMRRPTTSSACIRNDQTACMLNGRFAVAVRYRGTFDDAAADTSARVKQVTGFASGGYETAFFYFQDPNNIELLVKVLDQGNFDAQGRPTLAVLYGSATPLRLEFTVTDTTTSIVRRYTSRFGTQEGGNDWIAFVK